MVLIVLNGFLYFRLLRWKDNWIRPSLDSQDSTIVYCPIPLRIGQINVMLQNTVSFSWDRSCSQRDASLSAGLNIRQQAISKPQQWCRKWGSFSLFQSRLSGRNNYRTQPVVSASNLTLKFKCLQVWTWAKLGCSHREATGPLACPMPQAKHQKFRYEIKSQAKILGSCSRV